MKKQLKKEKKKKKKKEKKAKLKEEKKTKGDDGLIGPALPAELQTALGMYYLQTSKTLAGTVCTFHNSRLEKCVLDDLQIPFSSHLCHTVAYS